MKNSFKFLAVLALTTTLSACAKVVPTEGLVMSHFAAIMNQEIAQSELLEEGLRLNPEAADFFAVEKRPPSGFFRERLASAEFKGCDEGEQQGQMICFVKTVVGSTENTYELAYVNNGDQWQFTGNYR